MATFSERNNQSGATTGVRLKELEIWWVL